MLFSNILKATAAASLLLACAGVNAQSSWNSSQDLGLFVNPTKGIPSNVTIGASPTSSLSNTRLTVKSEAGQGGLKVINSEGSTKLWLNEKGGLSVGTSSSATTNGLLVSGQTRLRANLVVDNGAEIKGGMKLDGNADIKKDLKVDGTSSLERLRVWWRPEYDSLKLYEDELASLKVGGFAQINGLLYVSDYITDSYMVFGGERLNNYYGTVKDVNTIKSIRGDINSYNKAPLYFDADEHIFKGPASFDDGAFCWEKFTIGDIRFRGYSTWSPEYEKLRNKLILDVWGRSEFNSDVLVKGKLSCKGQIEVAELKANDIQMDMHGAADYVFDENYNLKSLSEVESYVNENKHLPGMPSAAEMEENGVSVSKMTNLLLEKVEELTLHMIQLEKENAALKAKVESLSK